MVEKNALCHVAIVPDGNRRWAREKKLPEYKGHFRGAEKFRDILQSAVDNGIKYISIWGGSFDNLTKRKKFEIKALFTVYDKYFKELLKDEKIFEEKVQVRFFGKFRELLPKKTIKIIEELEKKTEAHNGHFLSLLIGYSGTDEMQDAIRRIAKFQITNSKLQINEKLIKDNLWTGKLPEVDLIIRTGVQGDPHNSAGFMMWHTAYSQYYFTETLWPDFSPAEFTKACQNFLKTPRRLGA